MTDLPPIICPSCNATYRHPGRAGKTKCSKCGSAIMVVLPEGAAPAAAPRRSAGPGAPQPPRPRAPQPKPARPGVVVPHHRPHSRHGRPHTQVMPEGEHPLPRKQPGMSQGVMIACAATLGVAVIGVIIWLASGSGNDAPKPAPKKTAEKSDTPKRPRDELDNLLDAGGASNPTATDQPDITEPKAETPKETPKPKPPPAPKASKYETRYDDLKPFDPVPGTTPEEVKEIERLLEVAADFNSGADGYRAQDKVIAIGKKAIPITLNKYLEVNLDGNIDAIRRGKTFNEVLKDISGEIHSYAVTEDQEGGYYRSVARLQWHRWWDKNKSTWTGPADDEEEDF